MHGAPWLPIVHDLPARLPVLAVPVHRDRYLRGPRRRPDRSHIRRGQAERRVDTLQSPGMQRGPAALALGRLREHRRQQAEERLAAGSAWTDTGGLVFTTRWGEPLYPDTVTALMTKLINRHNRSATKPLPHARLHDLRHLHATTLLLAGVPVHVVAARLGHADPAVTLRVYSHVLREHAAGVGDIFAQAVHGSR